MSDQGSTYAILQNVPIMLSPLFTLPKKILATSDLKIVPEDVKKLPAYPFAVERQAIALVDSARKKFFEQEEEFKLKKQSFEEEKKMKQKVAARKIAPGFLDTETRILQPQQTYRYNEELEEPTSGPVSPRTLHQLPVELSQEKHLNYLEFEQGLAPADPWDTPENDMAALRSILGSPKSNFEQIPTPPQYPPHYSSPQYPQIPQHQPHQQPRPYQKNEGVYWNFQANNLNNFPSPQRSQPTSSLPAIPPKLFNNSPLPTSSTSSPTLPPPSDYHKSAAVNPPPLPPLPNQPNENLILELGNMGFNRAQAIDALEKNDYDLIKATHFLLDQA